MVPVETSQCPISLFLLPPLPVYSLRQWSFGHWENTRKNQELLIKGPGHVQNAWVQYQLHAWFQLLVGAKYWKLWQWFNCWVSPTQMGVPGLRSKYPDALSIWKGNEQIRSVLSLPASQINVPLFCHLHNSKFHILTLIDNILSFLSLFPTLKLLYLWASFFLCLLSALVQEPFRSFCFLSSCRSAGSGSEPVLALLYAGRETKLSNSSQGLHAPWHL